MNPKVCAVLVALVAVPCLAFGSWLVVVARALWVEEGE